MPELVGAPLALAGPVERDGPQLPGKSLGSMVLSDCCNCSGFPELMEDPAPDSMLWEESTVPTWVQEQISSPARVSLYCLLPAWLSLAPVSALSQCTAASSTSSLTLEMVNGAEGAFGTDSEVLGANWSGSALRLV